MNLEIHWGETRVEAETTFVQQIIAFGAEIGRIAR